MSEGILDYRNEGICVKCGYAEEAHINRGRSYQAYKPGKDGSYKFMFLGISFAF